MAPKNSGKQIDLTPEELEAALDVKPPADPQAAEEHVHQLLTRAQVSWLTKRDVLDILSNWQVYNLPISMMPPDQPGPGSLFLFDRNQLKSFRRDNHAWKSKAGGKTVQETHEKLKIDGGIPALNCYYAHSADGTLQRRCYWKLAGKTNIVLMHYRSPGQRKSTKGGPEASAQPLGAQQRVPVFPNHEMLPYHTLPQPSNDSSVPKVDGAKQEHGEDVLTHAVPPAMPPVQDGAGPSAVMNNMPRQDWFAGLGDSSDAQRFHGSQSQLPQAVHARQQWQMGMMSPNDRQMYGGLMQVPQPIMSADPAAHAAHVMAQYNNAGAANIPQPLMGHSDIPGGMHLPQQLSEHSGQHHLKDDLSALPDGMTLQPAGMHAGHEQPGLAAPAPMPAHFSHGSIPDNVPPAAAGEGDASVMELPQPSNVPSPLDQQQQQQQLHQHATQHMSPGDGQRQALAVDDKGNYYQPYMVDSTNYDGKRPREELASEEEPYQKRLNLSESVPNAGEEPRQ